MQIDIARADIASLEVDAVVNAANEQLARGRGVCGAIFAAAGPALDQACAAIGHCPTGGAVATPGFDLPAHWIIHTVGPIWRGGHHDEPALLRACYRRSLEVADELRVASVAFPALSTGVFGYPPDLAAEVAVHALRTMTTRVPLVVLCAFDRETEARYRSLLSSPGGP